MKKISNRRLKRGSTNKVNPKETPYRNIIVDCVPSETGYVKTIRLKEK